MFPTFLDIEASGLGNTSYPIEIAWNNSNGEILKRLIKPSSDWTSWDPEAECIHGITREEIEQDGISVDDMCSLIKESLTGITVYSDAPELERFWLNRLFQESEDINCPILTLGVSKIPTIKEICYERGLYDKFKNQAVDEVGIIHRADADVRILMSVFQQALDYINKKENKT